MANISSIIDGSIFGYFISLVLLGITLVQSWIYFHNNHDKWPLRTFVTVLVLLDLMQTSCATYSVHYYLISHFGEIDTLNIPTIMMSVDFTITSLMFFMVHLFFAHRLWKLGRSWCLPAIVTFTSTAMLALGGSAVYSQVLGRLTFSQFHQRRILIQSSLFHALGVVTDILVTVGLSWTLSKARTGFKDTQMVLQRLIVFTVTRGILVSLVQIGHIVMYVFHPNDMLFWAALHLILTKLYVLTTLVTLNSRRSLRDTLQSVVTDGYLLSFARPAPSHADNDVELGFRISEDPKPTKTPVDSPIIRAATSGLESGSSIDVERV